MEGIGKLAAEICTRLVNEYRTADKIAYFAPCERNGVLLRFPESQALQLNHCAAAQCYVSWLALSMLESSHPDCRIDAKTVIPHKYRAACVELIADAERLGHYVTRQEMLDTPTMKPQPGDLLFYDRSDPKRPETSWWRHVDRMTEQDPKHEWVVTSYGCNETPSGGWRAETFNLLEHPRFIGAIRYPKIVLDRSCAEPAEGVPEWLKS